MNNPYDHIQRIVDNEAATDERQTFFEYAEEAPEYWKELALAFVESQLISNALCRGKAAASGASPAGLLRVLGWAAILMLGLGLGAGGMWLRFAPGTEPPLTDVESPAPAVTEEFPVIRTLEAMRQAGQWVGHPDHPLQQASRFVEEQGYESSLQTAYLLTTREDGRKVILPVNQLSCHPVHDTLQP